MSIRLIFASAMLGLSGTPAISAETCDLPVATLAGFQNGTLLAEDDDGNWGVFKGFLGLTRPTSMSFAFVVRDDMKDRAGAVVVKTARWAPPRAGTRSNAVKLVRYGSFPDEKCSKPRFGAGTVSMRAYEDYHGRGFTESRALDSTTGADFSGRVRGVIESFHTTYPGAVGACRSSDATSYNGFEYRNNRSQFSYDTSVVDKGWSYATTNLLVSLIPPALAAPSRLLQQQTQIFHYRVKPTKPTCIMFDLGSATAEQVLRINDLEDRNSVFRADEKRWQPADVK